MAFYPGLVPLRDVLAELYPTKGIAQVVVTEAGLPEQLIDFEGAAVVFWKNILSVAQSNNQVQAVIDIARKHFPKKEELTAAEKVFHSTPVPQILAQQTEGSPVTDTGTIRVGGDNQGLIVGGNARGINSVQTGEISGDGNIVGGNTFES